MDQSILYPMFALFIFTHLVMFMMSRLRFMAVKKGEIDYKHFKTYDSGAKLPRLVQQVNRQYANLMEIPTLFYVGCLIIFFKGNATQLLLALAWGFVVLRILHGLIHMTSNKIMPRMIIFTAGVFVNVLLWCFALFS